MSDPSFSLRPARPEDGAACAEIYNYYILNTTYTFEEVPLSAEEFSERIAAVSARYPYLVAEEKGTVIAYAYLSPYGERSAYRYTADVSVYKAHTCHTPGVGTALLDALKEEGRRQGLAQLIAIVTGENTVSMRFHEKCGFLPEGRLARVGYKMGRWLDTVLYRFGL